LEPLAAKEAAVNGLEMRMLDEVPAIDVTFVQPSECAVVVVDGKKSFASLMGRETTPVQPDLQRAKAALKKSAKVVLMKELFVDKLGGSVPVVIEAQNWEEYAEELDDLFLGDAEVWRRGATFDANPRGGKNPYVSADGEHTIVDLRFEDPINSGRWECARRRGIRHTCARHLHARRRRRDDEPRNYGSDHHYARLGYIYLPTFF